MTGLDITLPSMFLLGLLGTGHCIGMCGPLVVAFPAAAGGVLPHLLYHGGRVTTYTAAGALAGGAGSLAAALGADPVLGTLRVQMGLSVAAGLLLAAFGLARLGLLPEPRWLYTAVPLLSPGSGAAASSRSSRWRMVHMGLLTGMLPCGLSYAAFSRALAAGGWYEGGMMTLAFGLGTLPGLLAAGLGAGRLLSRFRTWSDPLSGMLMIAMAVRLISRVIFPR
jgi:sulfite exporter TauE/SafE